MATFRIEKNQDFTVMSNYHLRDKNISLKAKGLLSFFLSLPKDWDYSLNGLVTVLKEKEDAITTILKELKQNKYLKITKTRNDKGLFEYIYDIYEIPYSDTPEVENPVLDNPALEVPEVENPPQINTNIINTNIINNICPLLENFEKIWKLYPRKDGKSKAFSYYKAWITGKQYAGRKEKLTDNEMRQAIELYKKEIMDNKIDSQYIKMGSTFFNDAIYEYAIKYKQSKTANLNDEFQIQNATSAYQENLMSEEEYYRQMKGKEKRYE